MLELVPHQTAITLPPSPELLLTGQLSPHTEAAYRRDVREFLRFTDQKPLPDVCKEDVLAFRDYLALERKQKPLTVNRKLTVVSQLFEEAKARGMVTQNPMDRVKRLKANQRESNTPWLSKSEGEALLNAPDLSTLKGVRDRAIFAIMLGAGLRRAEVAGMQVGDMAVRDGHHILTVRGKGGRVDVVKLRVDVWRRVQTWLEMSGRAELEPLAPVFVGLMKRGRGADVRYVPSVEKLNAHSLWGLVKGYAAKAGIPTDIRPHSLRHSFMTWALEEGASLHKVQYAARHADPRTTERYHRQKLNLDDNAVELLEGERGILMPPISSPQAATAESWYAEFVSIPRLAPVEARECHAWLHRVSGLDILQWRELGQRWRDDHGRVGDDQLRSLRHARTSNTSSLAFEGMAATTWRESARRV